MSFERSVERALDEFFEKVWTLAENHSMGKDRIELALAEVGGTDLAEAFEDWYLEGEA